MVVPFGGPGQWNQGHPQQGFPQYPPQQGFQRYPPQQGYQQHPPQQGFQQYPPQSPRSPQSLQSPQQGFQPPQQGFPPSQKLKKQGIPPLAPLPPPGVFCLPQCIAHQPVSLIIRYRSFNVGEAYGAGEDEAHTANGILMFKAAGAFRALRQRKEVYDNHGQHLFSIRAEVNQNPPSFYCETPEGHRFMDVFGKWSLFRKKSEVLFINNGDGREIKINLTDNYFNTHAEIKLDNGHVIACIDRDIFQDRVADEYMLTVAPGMDMALCFAICLSMDQRMRQGG